MIAYLTLVLDLLEIKSNDIYLQIGQYIIDHPSVTLSLCHPHGFLFAAFADFVAGRINQEQFIALGDTYSHIILDCSSFSCAPSLFVESVIYGLNVAPKHYANTLFLLQKPAVVVDYSSLHKQLQSIGSQIFFF